LCSQYVVALENHRPNNWDMTLEEWADKKRGQRLGISLDAIVKIFDRAPGTVRAVLRRFSVTVVDSAMKTEANRASATNKIFTRGGIDLSQQDAAMHVVKDANGGVTVNVDPALIARVEREGLSRVYPVIIDMRPANARALFGVSVLAH